MVCCAAVDTAGAAPGLDWLDGPALLVGGERRADLATPVLSLVEDGDPDPLLSWLAEVGVRSDKPSGWSDHRVGRSADVPRSP